MAEPAIVYPKACLKIGAIRLWGRLDVVELTPGVTPNSATLVCPKGEFSKLAGDYDRSGDLELYWSSATVPDVTLKAWSIDHVEETLHGNLAGSVTAEPLELTFTLTDRRWEMTGGRGGSAFWGVLNKTKEDGKAVTQDVTIEGITGTTGWTWYDIIRTLGVKLKCASGGYRLDPDYSPPVALSTMEKPRDWAVNGENIPAAIAKACEACEAVWTVGLDGQYYVYQIGSDTLPTPPIGVVRVADLPAGKRLPTTGYISRSMRDGAVVITSAPQPRIVQETMHMNDAEENPLWEYVGVDRDGSIKRLADLTYITGSGKTALAVIHNAFEDLDPDDRELARRSIGRMFRMHPGAAKTRLPLLARLAESATDADSQIRGLGLRVRAKAAYLSGQDYANSDDYLDLGVEQVDHVHGIVTCDGMVGRLDGLAENVWSQFVFLTGDELEIACSYESRSNGNYEDYWCKAYSMAGGAVVEAVLADTMDADTADVRIVSMPELRAYVVDDVVTNDEELGEFAASVAARLLKDPAASETLQYIGLHAITPSGTVALVRWDLSRGITTIEHNTYHISANRFLVRDAHGRTARAAKAGGAGVSSAPQLSSQGSGRWASPPDSLMGRADPDPGPRPIRVKITASELIDGETDKWEYTAVRTRKILAAHGGDTVWEPYDTENPLTLYNDAEWPNGGPIPVAAGTPVWAWPQFYTSGSPTVRTKEWWFCSTADGKVDSPSQMLPSSGSPNAETAQTDTWSALSPPANTAGAVVRQFRYAYGFDGDEILYGFYRDLTFDSAGRLTAWSAETRFTVDEPEEC